MSRNDGNFLSCESDPASLSPRAGLDELGVLLARAVTRIAAGDSATDPEIELGAAADSSAAPPPRISSYPSASSPRSRNRHPRIEWRRRGERVPSRAGTQRSQADHREESA